jgi:hypothetical protein
MRNLTPEMIDEIFQEAYVEYMREPEVEEPDSW